MTERVSRRGDECGACGLQGTGSPPYSNTRKVNFPSDSRTTLSQASCD